MPPWCVPRNQKSKAVRNGQRNRCLKKQHRGSDTLGCEIPSGNANVRRISRILEWNYQYLDWFDHSLVREPLRPDWNHLRSDDKEVAFVWSTEHKYAGCPDLIGEIGGVRVIADFKTSNAPYMSTFPDRGDRIGFGGYRKYTKCAQQMAAYGTQNNVLDSFAM